MSSENCITEHVVELTTGEGDGLLFVVNGLFSLAGAFVGLRQYSKPPVSRLRHRGLRGGHLEDDDEW